MVSRTLALLALFLAPLVGAFNPRASRTEKWSSSRSQQVQQQGRGVLREGTAVARTRVLVAGEGVEVPGTGADGDIPRLDLTPPIRVGLLIEPTPFTHVSGYSNRFKELLKFLQKAKDVVEIVTVDDLPESPKSFGKYPIHTIKGFRFPLYKEICLAFDAKQQEVWKLMRRFKPDLIHCSSPGFIVFMALAAAKWFDVPLLLSYHTHLPMYMKQYIGGLPEAVQDRLAWGLIRYVHNSADLTLVTSPQMKEEMEAQGIERVDVWRKGVDTDRFNPSFKSEAMRQELSGGAPPGSPLLLYVGRLGHEKRLMELKATLELIPDARLAFVGKGPAEADLVKHFAGKHVKFMGLLDGERLSQAFASADLFVMPSDSETLGFVVIESMASGVPVVGAKAGGIPSIIRHGDTGLLAAPRDPHDFAAKVKSLLGDRGRLRRMAAASRDEMAKHGWEAATAYLRNVQYRKAIENFKNNRNVDVNPAANSNVLFDGQDRILD